METVTIHVSLSWLIAIGFAVVALNTIATVVSIEVGIRIRTREWREILTRATIQSSSVDSALSAQNDRISTLSRAIERHDIELADMKSRIEKLEKEKTWAK